MDGNRVYASKTVDTDAEKIRSRNILRREETLKRVLLKKIKDKDNRVVELKAKKEREKVLRRRQREAEDLYKKSILEEIKRRNEDKRQETLRKIMEKERRADELLKEREEVALLGRQHAVEVRDRLGRIWKKTSRRSRSSRSRRNFVEQRDESFRRSARHSQAEQSIDETSIFDMTKSERELFRNASVRQFRGHEINHLSSTFGRHDANRDDSFRSNSDRLSQGHKENNVNSEIERSENARGNSFRNNASRRVHEYKENDFSSISGRDDIERDNSRESNDVERYDVYENDAMRRSRMRKNKDGRDTFEARNDPHVSSRDESIDYSDVAQAIDDVIYDMDSFDEASLRADPKDIEYHRIAPVKEHDIDHYVPRSRREDQLSARRPKTEELDASEAVYRDEDIKKEDVDAVFEELVVLENKVTDLEEIVVKQDRDIEELEATIYSWKVKSVFIIMAFSFILHRYDKGLKKSTSVMTESAQALPSILSLCFDSQRH